ncbi:MAG: hypothetical protein J7L61_03775 [Thermoplasmata archaeon]|nr:hypothetical protein [Thermoplasmata archaeon]
MDRRTGLLLIRIGVAAVSVMVALALVVGVYSMVLFFTGGEDFPISMPDPDQVTVEAGPENTLTFSAPLVVENNGIYPVEDLGIYLTMTYEGKEIFKGVNDLGTIPPHSSVTKTITFSTSAGHLLDQGLGEVFFRDVNTTIRVDVNGRYVFSWIGFSLHFSTPTRWEAPVNITTIPEDAKFSVSGSGGNASLQIPLTVRTAEWLSGNATVRTEVEALGIGSLDGGEFSFPLGGVYNGSLVLNMTSDTATRLVSEQTVFRENINIVLDIDGRSVQYNLSREEEWLPPLGGLDISVENVSGTVNVDVAFQNMRDTGGTYTVSLWLLDSPPAEGSLGSGSPDAQDTRYVGGGEGYSWHTSLIPPPDAEGYLLQIEEENLGSIYIEGGAL